MKGREIFSDILCVILRFLMRAGVGMGLIFIINHYVLPAGSIWNVGMNYITFLTSGTLGIPGVCLLYGMLVVQTL